MEPEGKNRMPFFQRHRLVLDVFNGGNQSSTLRFIEECEYHEIAAAQTIPIGTAQWRVFNAKKKLASHLKRIDIAITRVAA